MNRASSSSAKYKEKPNWVFPWRPLGETNHPKWIAILLVSAAYAFFLSTVKIHATPPIPWATKKATVIQVADNTESQTLRLQAQEEGPFPARFSLSEWSQFENLEKDAFSATQWKPPAYRPSLKKLPDQARLPLQLSSKGKPVLPKNKPSDRPSSPSIALKPTPYLYPLAGITPSAPLPSQLPPYDGAATTSPLRFLIRLDAAGNVIDCISLVGGEETKANILENWLRRITFPPVPNSSQQRWIAVAVGFTNQSSDGLITH